MEPRKNPARGFFVPLFDFISNKLYNFPSMGELASAFTPEFLVAAVVRHEMMGRDPQTLDRDWHGLIQLFPEDSSGIGSLRAIIDSVGAEPTRHFRDFVPYFDVDEIGNFLLDCSLTRHTKRTFNPDVIRKTALVLRKRVVAQVSAGEGMQITGEKIIKALLAEERPSSDTISLSS